MRINSIDIAAFGKLTDFHLEFPDGMTVVFGENEMGKTTIMSFIHMMFYGNSGKTTDVARNPRVKYRPWNSELMAGSVTFTFKGTRYRLEREFKKSNSADKITLINLDLNTVQSISGSDDIGAKFFGLTDAAFRRSVFIGELKSADKNEAADGEINARLANFSLTCDEDTSFETVRARLQSAKEELLSRSGKKGKYDKARIRFNELEREIGAALERESEAEMLIKKAKEKELEIKESSKETARLFELLKNADKIKKRIFVQRYIDAEKELALYNSKLGLSDGGTADAAFVADAHKLYDDTVKASDRLKATQAEAELLNGEISRLSNSVCEKNNCKEDRVASAMAEEREAIDRKIEALRTESLRLHTEIEALKPEKKINPLFIALGTITAAVGVIFAGIQLYAAIALISAGLVMAICGVIFKKAVKPDDSLLQSSLAKNSQALSTLLDQKQNLLERLSSHEKSVNSAQVRLAADKALLESKMQETAQKNSELSSALGEYKAKTEALFAHLSRLTRAEDVDTAKRIIEETAEAVKSADLIRQKLSLLADHAGCSSLVEAEEKMAVYSALPSPSDMSEEDIDRVKESFKSQSDITGKMRSELAALKAQIKSISDADSSTAVLIRERQELMRQMDKQGAFCDRTDIAAEVLEEAFREIRRNYSGRLDSRTAEIFKRLSDERYRSVNISKNFETSVTTEDAFGLKAAEYLSCGTEAQLYLSLRLAIAELITDEGESLPIFMDDPLAEYDDNRAENAISFLSEYSKNKQTVMFTCHSALADMAKEHNINILEL